MATAKVVDVKNGSGNGPKLPEMTQTIHVEHTDIINGLTYSGDFVIKHLRLKEIGQAGVQRSRMNGGVDPTSLDPRVDQLHSMLSHLKFAIVKAPDWWKPEDFYTMELVDLVYEKVMEFEYSFRRPMGERPEGAPVDSAGGTERPAGNAAPVVDPEVSAPANL